MKKIRVFVGRKLNRLQLSKKPPIAENEMKERLSLMRKAAAIVTNEGGLLSHAAILSREMKKPCLIGTKNATDIFKDGDQVEVDADTGLVKKIK